MVRGKKKKRKEKRRKKEKGQVFIVIIHIFFERRSISFSLYLHFFYGKLQQSPRGFFLL